MSIRPTQKNLYANTVLYANNALSNLMDLNMQSSSQKKVNRPSDDPAGIARIMTYKTRIQVVERYETNVDTAKGWLSTADNTLLQVNTVLARTKELAEQGATGTYSAANRKQISFEIRQLMGQLTNLANTDFENRSIFAGHKYDESAYVSGQMLQSTADPTLQSYFDVDRWAQSVSGAELDSTMTVKFVDSSGALPAGTQTTIGSGAISGLTARYSLDGGQTWNEQAVSNTSFTLHGVAITLREGAPITLSNRNQTVLNDGRTVEELTGSTFFVMPTAYYQGDTENQVAVNITGATSAYDLTPSASFEKDVHFRNVSVTTINGQNHLQYEYSYSDDPASASAVWSNGSTLITSNGAPYIRMPEGDVTINGITGTGSLTNLEFSVLADTIAVQQQMGTEVNAWANGNFRNDALVRIDATSNGAATYDFMNEPVNYSYSTDNGVTWVTGQTARDGIFDLPGGTMNLSPLGTTTTIAPGDQFFVHPRQADLSVEVANGSYVQINNVGSEIFGGYYSDTMAEVYNGVSGAGNLFNAMGKLAGYLEINSQTGVQQALEELTIAAQSVAVAAANIGGRENRVEITSQVLSSEILDKSERLSTLEDIDVAELMTDLAQAQLVYESVLKSSSMVMNMSLVNYI